MNQWYESRKAMFTNNVANWRTPNDLFNQLDSEFHFTLDVCADSKYSLKPRDSNFDGWSGEEALNRSWKGYTCYMNPPYGREVHKWLSKAWMEKLFNQVTTVALLPTKTDTNWFWSYCIDQEIRLIKGRVRFLNDNKDELPAPFPSMIVVFKP